jgi:hypothetical protein
MKTFAVFSSFDKYMTKDDFLNRKFTTGGGASMCMVGEIYGKIVYKFRGGDIRLVCPQSLWENYFE